MGKRTQWYAKTTAAIPGVRIWEHVIMFMIAFSAIKNLLMVFGPALAPLALGPFAPWYYSIQLLAVLLFEGGQFLVPPNGLVVSMLGAMLISISALAVYGGLAVVMGTLFFTGYAVLLIFAIGGFLRTGQMFLQLGRLQKTLSDMQKRENNVHT